MTIRAENLSAGDVILGKRNRKVRAVFNSTFRDGNATRNVVYAVIPSMRGRGLVMEEFNIDQPVRVRKAS